jgi:ABC-type sugar transport system permease subunit
MKRKGLTIRQREIVSGYLFILPWIVGMIIFFLYNVLQAGVYSFNAIVIDPERGGFSLDWQGWENFRYAVLSHASFNRQLVDTVVEMVWNVPLIIFFSLFVAIILNRDFMCRGLVRAIFFMPVILATPAIQGSMDAILRLMMGGVSNIPPDVQRAAGGFHAGSLALIIADFGIPMQFTEYIVEAIGRLHEVIRASGVQILIFLAALQAIPSSMYEVAHIEGATGYETFWKVTFPMVSPLILTNVIYTIVDNFAQSEVVQTAFNTAFTNQNFGLSSAMSIISALVVLLFMLIVGWLISRKVFYQN